jgi:hypothetical protein
MDYFGTYHQEVEGEANQALLQTIVVPKNLLFLSDRLPQSNYEPKSNRKHNSFTKKAHNDLPEIKLNSIVNKLTKRVINTKIDEAKDYSMEMYRDASSDRIIKRIERGRNIAAKCGADRSRNYTHDDKKGGGNISLNPSHIHHHSPVSSDSRSKERLIQPIMYEMAKKKREYLNLF